MHTSENQTFKIDRLSVFSLLWAAAEFFHFCSTAKKITLTEPFGWLVSIFFLLVLLNPKSTRLFLLLVLFTVFKIFSWMPFNPNHITFEMVMDTGIVLSAIWLLVSGKYKWSEIETPAFRDVFFDRFTPILRTGIVVLYFYAVIHKLNSDYFNVEISCSSILLEGFNYRFPFLPHFPKWMLYVSVWGSLIIEAAIPLLFAFRSTRTAGIILGLLFHYLLALNPEHGLISFSSMLFAIFFLFTPPDFTRAIASVADSLGIERLNKLISRFKLAVLITVGIMLLLLVLRQDAVLRVYFFVVWCIWGTVLMAIFLNFALKKRYSVIYDNPVFAIKPAVFYIFPLLLLFNGMNPYLGLKTETSFSMFSNLRTEAGITNHLFIPSSLQMTRLQYDLVEITESDLPHFNKLKTGRLIVYFEFRRAVSENAGKNFYVKYLRNGQPEMLIVKDGTSNKPELLVKHPYLVRKFAIFRQVEKEGPCTCKH